MDIFAENYFVSPQIRINDETTLNFKVRCSNNEYYPETFKVLLSDGSNSNITDFYVEIANYTVDNTSYQDVALDLSEYVGKNIYIAFYHYIAENNLGSEQLIIDDVVFANENAFEKGRAYLVSYQNAENVAEFKGNLNNLAKDAMCENMKKYIMTLVFAIGLGMSLNAQSDSFFNYSD